EASMCELLSPTLRYKANYFIPQSQWHRKRQSGLPRGNVPSCCVLEGIGGARGGSGMQKKFRDLRGKEILALAIENEEEDGRIFGEFADALRDSYPATAEMFEEMRQEEVGHRDRLFEQFRARFGEHIPLIRRENVKGFLQRRPVWLVRPLGVNAAR